MTDFFLKKALCRGALAEGKLQPTQLLPLTDQIGQKGLNEIRSLSSALR